jgi:DNA-binding response OmpR family regulator
VVRLLRHFLEKERFGVICAGTGEKGLRLAQTTRPDLVILDIMLPGMDGFEFLRILRRKSRVPVILLSAKRSEADRILGLKLGADDYVTKPFSLGELGARIEGHLRRAAAALADEDGPGSVTIGRLTIDFVRHEVLVKGGCARLAPKEFELLKALIEADGKVLSRDRLREFVWGHGQGIKIDTRTVDQHIARLRRKLGAEGVRVETVHNYGYRIKR